MTDVTDADRTKAQAALGWDGVAFELLTRDVQRDVLEVAKALAEERAKALKQGARRAARRMR